MRQTGAPIRGVEFNQRIAGPDALVVDNLDREHLPLDPRAEYRDIAADIGVVGGFDPLPFGEITKHAEPKREQYDQQTQQAQAASSAFRRLRGGWARGRVANGDGLFDDGVHAGRLR